MRDFETRFSSRRQDWTTPDDLWLPLHKEFKFTLDAAASAETTKCRRYFTAQDNALARPWGRAVGQPTVRRARMWESSTVGIQGTFRRHARCYCGYADTGAYKHELVPGYLSGAR